VRRLEENAHFDSALSSFCKVIVIADSILEAKQPANREICTSEFDPVCACKYSNSLDICSESRLSHAVGVEIVLVFLNILKSLRQYGSSLARLNPRGLRTLERTHIEYLVEPPQGFAVLLLFEVVVSFLDHDPEALHFDQVLERRRSVLL
jgi:hypothetical protein